MRALFIVCILIAFTCYSCIEAPNYPAVPHIEFKSASKNFLKSGEKDTITFSFTDGDGDIGVDIPLPDTGGSTDDCLLQQGDSSELYAENFNIFLINNATLCIDPFASATITPTGRFKGVSGDIDVILQVFSTICSPPQPGCPNDTVVYTIVLRDKAGHFSNFVQTSAIVVTGEP